jgi:hypothetical protein
MAPRRPTPSSRPEPTPFGSLRPKSARPVGLRDATDRRRITLSVEYLGHARDPWDNDRAVFTGGGTINREDWGLTWNMVLEAGGLLVSKEIRLEIDVELIRQ